MSTMAAESKLFVDLSSNNPVPSRRQLKRHWKAGRRILVLKVSQGTSYTWSDSSRLSVIWHKLGGTVGHYHWLNPGDADSGREQAGYFWSHVTTDLVDGDIVICDFEQQGAGAAELGAFWARIDELLGARGVKVNRWTYSGAYFIRSAKAKPHGTEWWGAGYPELPFTPAGWGKPVAHQYTDKANAPGMSGTLDQSELLRDLEHGKPTPKPIPHSQRQANKRPLHFGPIRSRVTRRLIHALMEGRPFEVRSKSYLRDLDCAYQQRFGGSK